MQPTTIITSDKSSNRVPITYPTIGMVIDELLEIQPDRDDWHDESVCEAISKWDSQFADDPDWYCKEPDWRGNDIRDELRFDVENALGLEF